MVEQLQSTEQQLQRSQSTDIITELVTAKILAADKDYLALELQVWSCLNVMGRPIVNMCMSSIVWVSTAEDTESLCFGNVPQSA